MAIHDPLIPKENARFFCQNLMRGYDPLWIVITGAGNSECLVKHDSADEAFEAFILPGIHSATSFNLVGSLERVAYATS